MNPLREIAAADAAAHFRRRAHRKQPVIIRGLATAWPARTRWTPGYLADHLGDRMVRLACWSGATPPGDPVRFVAERRHTPRRFADFLADFARGAVPRNTYASDLRVLDAGGPLAGDFEPPQRLLFGPRWPARLRRALSLPPGLWIGGAGMITPLHYDWNENFHVVLAGRKRWTLFPPTAARALHAPAPGLAPIFTPIDLARPDHARFPRFAALAPHAHTGELAAGDALFVPVGWWHHAHTLADTIALSHWSWSLAACRTYAKVVLQSIPFPRFRGDSPP